MLLAGYRPPFALEFGSPRMRLPVLISSLAPPVISTAPPWRLPASALVSSSTLPLASTTWITNTSRLRRAGPSTRMPVGRYFEPWHGHSNRSLVGTHLYRQPRCTHTV